MSTWQLFSDAGNNVRWEISDQHLCNQEAESNRALEYPPPQSHRLPSMADLLLQGTANELLFTGYSRFTEVRDGNSDNTPSFRSGLGKSVAVKQSSISRALAILGDEGDAVTQTGCSRLRDVRHGNLDSASSFRTGLGESVGVKQSSIPRAFEILSDGGDEVIPTGQQIRGDNEFGFSNTISWTGPRKAINVPKSALRTSLEQMTDTSNSFFQTASGKTVSLSSAGLLRAKALLGPEEHGDCKNFEDLEQEGQLSTSYQPSGLRSSFLFEGEAGVNNTLLNGDIILPISPLDGKINSASCQSKYVIPDFLQSAPKPPPVKFQTAGGRSISVSNDALKRALSLLGDQEAGAYSDEGDAADHEYPFSRDRESKNTKPSKENDPNTPFPYQETANSNHLSKNFTSPFRSNSCQRESSVRPRIIGQGSNLIKKFDAEAKHNLSSPCNSLPSYENHLRKKTQVATMDSLERPSSGPLVDISNSIGANSTDVKWNSAEKRRLGRSTVSPFKRPRSSKFITPFCRNKTSSPNGMPSLTTNEISYEGRVSTRLPFQVSRLYVKEYFREPPFGRSKIENLSDEIRRMNPGVAEYYTFPDDFGSGCIGAEEFYHMLVQPEVSPYHVSKEWVKNHYKWIVWKLASYERCYPAKFSGKLLSVSNVLEELKYRYDKEVNHGHRSAVKRILEGDAPPSSRMVLCISSVLSVCGTEVGCQPIASREVESGAAAKIELTDGWYSIIALLDVLLSKKLAAGKLFIGQKLTIWGAGLCGWAGPVSPLEAPRTSTLLLHMNGTYRTHWADRLGFCKVDGLPLAFRSIKSTGGVVPSTLVGILRIYPVVYWERSSDGGFIVRSERMYTKMLHSYNKRRSVVVEDVLSKFQGENETFHTLDDNDSEEGAKIMKMLEKAAEPEVIMAEMTSEQLTSFASYQAKLEMLRHSDMQKSLETALKAAGLGGREVTPFMRVKVVGLTSKDSPQKCFPHTGLITIWNPTEKQQSELVEGRVYAVSCLTPSTSDSSTLYLQTNGSSTKWLSLSPSAIEHFKPFFTPRKSILLSNLGEVSLSSEFDIAACVVYVGDAYTTDRHKKQWVFVTDGSIHGLHSREPLESLLAIGFCSPFSDGDMLAPVNYNLAGSTVGFCNLIKRAKDQVNNVWVAEATENSTYSLTFDDRCYFSHLKEAAASTQKWASNSSLAIEILRKRVVSIVSNSEA
ncbi:protein BREAST CANCER SUSCEPTIBILITY 2 homolog B [Coffea arabica]|uniref:Protein BREAST CANCER SUSCEPTIBILITY 2 homolog B n=1 Tax=Coffea arabica TaxID=13443 RepID=A0A6P6SV92_COFAR|nr:protein BREAST CANCER SUSCEPTIBILITY 2 homolog B-like [Coffea arabica]